MLVASYLFATFPITEEKVDVKGKKKYVAAKNLQTYYLSLRSLLLLVKE